MFNSSPLSASFQENNFMKYNGTSDEYVVFATGELVVVKLFLGLFSVVGSLENIAVVVAILTNEILLDVASNWFILSLAFADVLVCLASIPHLCRLPNSALMVFRGVLQFTLISSSGNLLVLTFSRFLSIVESLKYPSRMTLGRAKCLVFFAWMTAIVLSIVFALPFLIKVQKFLYLTVITYHTGITLLTIALNAYMVKKASDQRKIINVQRKAFLTGQQKSLISEYRSLLRLVMVTVTYLAAYILYIIIAYLYRTKDSRQSVAFQRRATFVHLIFLLNAVIDPLIYFTNRTEFQRFLIKARRRIFKCQKKSRPWSRTVAANTVGHSPKSGCENGNVYM